MTREQQNELYELSKPIIKWIELYGYPYLEVKINDEQVTVTEVKFSCPASVLIKKDE